jgi:ATP-binding cassette subfamily C (CFTR/MRP) protein 1
LRQADNIVLLPQDLGGKIENRSYEVLCASGLLKPEVIETSVNHESKNNEEETKEPLGLEELAGPDVDEVNDLDRKTGDFSEYQYYLKAIGLPKFINFLSFATLNAFSSSFATIWLKWWSDIQGHQIGLYISVYFLLSLGYSLGIGGYAWYLLFQVTYFKLTEFRAIAVIIAPSTGRLFHRRILNTIFSAPMSFFTKTEIGTILNRFSQDMSMIEGPLSNGLLATVTS